MDAATTVGLISFALVVSTYGTVIGAGGGFILIPGLVLLFDMNGVQAVGTGTVTLVAIGFTGAINYDRARLVHRGAAGWFAAGSVPTALLCAWFVADRIDAELFTSALGFVLIALAIFVMLAPHTTADDQEIPKPRRCRLMTGGVGVGALSGTFAVGGGLLTVPQLTSVQKLRPHRAAATTSATATMASFAGATGHTIAGNVIWSHAALLVTGAIVGSTLGARLAGRLPARAVLIGLATGLIVAGASLLLAG
ncbi:MAG: sulfite exporter TauE/SafE family protein [Acidimicrobiaceae bacterium]|nr:sulfite exporter TauE/SafE family protein [Acidimicrobiaceae bacterium]MBT5579879.1 sulfite exporter TauE/SafE family protein [Acidimicrobiaceae bacterium]MBT5851574.1 sulfite exporter TauE/SafE family protein [Acidimicrobiaceae bacterium]